MSKTDGDSTSVEKNSLSVSENGADIESDKHAVDFGGESKLPPPPKLTPEQEKKLYRKIDFRLMPILSLMYLCSFLDRGAHLQPSTPQGTDTVPMNK